MSRLYLRAERQGERTVITESSFTSPLKIAVPFYRGDFTEVMMMSASAGMLEGDDYDIRIHVCEGAALKFTGQSFDKIFKCSEGGRIIRKVKINVESGGKLIYLQQPAIPFAGSRFFGETDVRLRSGSVFVIQDVLSCGRAAMNEKFGFREYRSRLSVKKEGKLVFLDNIRLSPEEINLSGTGFYEGYTHSGIMYIHGTEVPDIPENVNGAVTSAAAGKCVRILSDSAQDITDVFENMINSMNF